MGHNGSRRPAVDRDNTNLQQRSEQKIAIAVSLGEQQDSLEQGRVRGQLLQVNRPPAPWSENLRIAAEYTASNVAKSLQASKRRD